MPYQRLSTGNELVSISEIFTDDAGIHVAGFMHAGFRGCIELHGDDDNPLLKPVVEIDGRNILSDGIQSELVHYWIPRFTKSQQELKTSYLIFAPLDRRGFVCVLSIENQAQEPVKLRAGWKGCWKSSFHTAKLKKSMSGLKHAGISSWQVSCPVIEFRGETPLFAIAAMSEDAMNARFSDNSDSDGMAANVGGGVSVDADFPLSYEMIDEYVLQPNETRTIPFYIGIGLEEVSAVASARELRLQGWERLLESLSAWLVRHLIKCDDDRLNEIINRNSFYNYFYSQAVVIDKEDLALMTARSSRNESCATYWDRDAMRWSLPAVLQIDWQRARNMMTYAYTTQLRNVGMHSRYIDGVVIEPGLQLDQLCAPLRGLSMYVDLTGDMSVLFDRRIQTGINTIQQILAAQRHPEAALFETLLLPSGEPSVYPYACYSNVLVWRSLLDLSGIYNRIRDFDRSQEAAVLSGQVRDAILRHFVVNGPMGDMYARSVDLHGNYELGDDPEGSLQLLTYFGFCAPSDPIYNNTMEWIRSEHNPRRVGDYAASDKSKAEGNISLLSIINDLLANRKNEALEFLRRAELDDGIACGVVDSSTGKATGGYAFASCAGFLAFALRYALGIRVPAALHVQKKQRQGEILYAPPPEPSYDIKKARL